MDKPGSGVHSSSTRVSLPRSSCSSKRSTRHRRVATVRSPSLGVRVVTFPCTTNFNRRGRLSMPQCTRLSFSKTCGPAIVLLATLLSSSATQSQNSNASQPSSGQDAAAQKPTELDGQIDKTLKNMKRDLDRRKANEPSLAANESRASRSAVDLAREATEFFLDPRNDL